LETWKNRIRYAGRSGKKGKTVLIDEFCEVTGHDRKYGIKLLTRNRGVEGSGGAKGRPKTYGAGELTVLKEIWFLAEQPCGKRLSPVLPMWLKSYKKRNGKLGYGVEKKLKEISPDRPPIGAHENSESESKNSDTKIESSTEGSDSNSG
jgi:hypothetical protein